LVEPVKVVADQSGARASFHVEPEAADHDRVPIAARAWYGGPRGPSSRGSMRLVRRTTFFDLPVGARLADLHPDVLALACAFLVLPFVGWRLRAPRAVSAGFASAFTEITGLGIEPVNGGIAPNRPPPGSRPGLAFSGGADSAAAAVLLPADAALVHLVRARSSPWQWAGYQPWAAVRQDAGRRACQGLAARGHDVHLVASNLEYLTAPMGRPTVQAIEVPVLLLTAALGIGAVAVGRPLETTFGLAGGKFTDLGEPWAKVVRLHAAAGLEYLPAALALPEVATTKVVIDSDLADVVSSCVRGTVEACGRCVKCLRKGLVMDVLRGWPPVDAALSDMFRSAAVIRELTARPIHHENVYAWLCSRYAGSSAEMTALCALVGGGDTAWNERSFEPAFDRLASPLGATVKARAAHYIDPMSRVELDRLRHWHARSAEPQTASQSDALRDVLLADRRLRVWMAMRSGLARAWRRARRIN
jgi:uncharacterized protein DUF6395